MEIENRTPFVSCEGTLRHSAIGQTVALRGNERKMRPPLSKFPSPCWASLLSRGSDLVFGGIAGALSSRGRLGHPAMSAES